MFRRTAKRFLVRAVVPASVAVGTVEFTTHLPSQGRSSLFYHKVADEWITPLLRQFLNPEVAHDISIYMAARGFAPRHHPSALEQRVSVESTVFGKRFTNPIGLGAGYDKDGQIINEMLALGFGFVEIGTVTPQPQPGNPSPRMFRLPHDLGIINRYGFNSSGAAQVELNLRAYRLQEKLQLQHEANSHHVGHASGGVAGSTTTNNQQLSVGELLTGIVTDWLPILKPKQRPLGGVVGVNIGKNKWTVGDESIQDYVSNIEKLGPYADYLVINISSPNTAGLRDMQHKDTLRPLLTACLEARDRIVTPSATTSTATVAIQKVPLLVKIAPDLTNEQLHDIATLCMELHVDGLVVTNTTNQRPSDLVSFHRHEVGGLSGAPIKDRSTECIRQLYAACQGTIPIIGVGGVGSGRDAYEKFRAGASLVQVYSMMVYHGPGLISRIRHELAELMLQHGQRNLHEVIGLDHEDLSWRQRQERILQQRQQQEDTLYE